MAKAILSSSTRIKILLLLFFVVIASAIVIVITHYKKPYPPVIVNYTEQRAINEAKRLYEQKISSHADISTGPCLSNDLLPDWVADLVHNPRQSIDNLPQNQCQAYLEGRAHHFVELDLNGNVVQVK